jgi:hypothetical protein
MIGDGDILVGRRGRGRKKPSPYLLRLIDESRPKLLVEHPEIEYWARADGLFEVDGEKWAPLNILAPLLGISAETIKTRISSCRQRDGRDRGGRLTPFYAVSDIKKACGNLIKKVPQTNKDGVAEIGTETWGTVKATSRILGLSEGATKTRLPSCRHRDGKDSSGHPVTLYLLADAKEACADLLKKVSQAGPDGTFLADGEKWATINILKNLLGLAPQTISRRLPSCRQREGKDKSGHPATFYSVTEVRKACKSVRKYKPRQPKR